MHIYIYIITFGLTQKRHPVPFRYEAARFLVIEVKVAADTSKQPTGLQKRTMKENIKSIKNKFIK